MHEDVKSEHEELRVACYAEFRALYFTVNSERKIMLTRLNTMAPKKADQKLAMANPGTRLAANISISALITNRKSPSVRMRDRKGNDLDNETDGRVDEADDDRCDQCWAEAVDLDAGKHIGDDDQADGADDPMNQ